MDTCRGSDKVNWPGFGGDAANQGGLVTMSNDNQYQPFPYTNGGALYDSGYGAQVNPPFPNNAYDTYNGNNGGISNGNMPYQMPHNQHHMINTPISCGPPYGQHFMTHHSNTAYNPTGFAIPVGARSGTGKAKRRKRDKDRPKRPLSAYNLFFQDERAKILKSIPGSGEKKESEDRSQQEDNQNTKEQTNTEDNEKGKGTKLGKNATRVGSKRSRKKRPHGKIGFESLAREIGKRWKTIDPEGLSHYKAKAVEDSERYAKEMEEYGQRVEAKKQRKEEEEEEKQKQQKEEEEEKQKRESASLPSQDQSLSSSSTPSDADVSNEEKKEDNKNISTYQKNQAKTEKRTRDDKQGIHTYNVPVNDSGEKSPPSYGGMNQMANGNGHWFGNDAEKVYGHNPNVSPSTGYYGNMHPSMNRDGNGGANASRFKNGQWGVDAGIQYQQQGGYGTFNSTMMMGGHDNSYQQQMFPGWNQDTSSSYGNMQGPEGASVGPHNDMQKPQYDNGFMGGAESQHHDYSGYI